MALSLLQFFGVQHLLIGILLLLHHGVVAFVSDDRVLVTLVPPTFSVLSPLIRLNLFIQHTPTTRVLHDRRAPHSVPITASKQRQLVDTVQTVVVQLRLGSMLILHKRRHRSQFVALGSTIRRNSRQLCLSRSLTLG